VAGYLTLENVVLLPHLGSATVATTMRWASLALDGIVAVGRGSSQPSPVTDYRTALLDLEDLLRHRVIIADICRNKAETGESGA